jgi:hypothetical protein
MSSFPIVNQTFIVCIMVGVTLVRFRFVRMLRVGAFFVLSLLLTSESFAAPHPPAERDADEFMVDLGAFMNKADERAKLTPGPDNSQLAGFLRARPSVHLFSRLLFEPSLGILLPWRGSVDGSTKIFTFQFDLDFSIMVFRAWRLRFGPGALAQVYLPGNDTVVLSNGTGSSTFYTPSRFSSSLQFTAEVGLEIFLFKSVSLNLDLYGVDPANNSSRYYNAAASLGFAL